MKTRSLRQIGLLQFFVWIIVFNSTWTHLCKKATNTLQKHVRTLLFFGSVCFFFDCEKKAMVQKFNSTRTPLRSVPTRALFAATGNSRIVFQKILVSNPNCRRRRKLNTFCFFTAEFSHYNFMEKFFSLWKRIEDTKVSINPLLP